MFDDGRRSRTSPQNGIPDLDIVSITSNLGSSPICDEVIYAPVIDSTMNCHTYMRTLGRDIRPGQVIVAGVQTGGVGMRGAWVSSVRDLAFTMVLNDPPLLRDNIFIGVAAGLAVLETAIDLAQADYPHLRVKLLNDVLCVEDDTPRKLSGVLEVGKFQEAFRTKYLIEKGYVLPKDLFLIGVGVNLSAEAESRPDLRRPAISMQSVLGRVPSREDFLSIYLGKFSSLHKMATEQPESFVACLERNLYIAETRELRLLMRNGQSRTIALARLSAEGFVNSSSELIEFEKVSGIDWDL